MDKMKKRVLITGAAGFIGSALARKLKALGHKVYATQNKTPVSGRACHERVYCDLNNEQQVRDAVALANPDWVFHLAASAIVGDAEGNSVLSARTNSMGTFHLLDALRKSHVSAVVVASTDKVYGRCSVLPYTESTPLMGFQQVYEASKLAEDQYAQMAHYDWNLPIGITRFGNVYGPGDLHFSRIIPYAIRCMYDGDQIVLRSDGQHQRDFVYIDDVVGGYVKLVEYQETAGGLNIFNFGTGIPARVADVAALVASKFNGKEPNIKFLCESEEEIHVQYLDSTKANRLLKWKSQVSLSVGIDKSLGWYREYLNGWSR
jgi:CDP-glucose 4,6-dehydratase